LCRSTYAISDGARPARRIDLRTLGHRPPMAFFGNGRRAWTDLTPAAASRSESISGGARCERHRELAADPFARSTAEEIRCGRGLFVTSGAARKDTRRFWGAYAVTKAALEHSLVSDLCGGRECESSNVKGESSQPGPLRTKMRAKAMAGENPQIARSARNHRTADRGIAVARLREERRGSWITSDPELDGEARQPAARYRRDKVRRPVLAARRPEYDPPSKCCGIFP